MNRLLEFAKHVTSGIQLLNEKSRLEICFHMHVAINEQVELYIIITLITTETIFAITIERSQVFA